MPRLAASMRPRGQTPRMLTFDGKGVVLHRASMRPRGQTPRMPPRDRAGAGRTRGFNEAAGADPADAPAPTTCRVPGVCDFNEAAGADPADAAEPGAKPRTARGYFNEAAGADPADALKQVSHAEACSLTSMRPRGQTPRMHGIGNQTGTPWPPSMRPRGQTPRMRATTREHSSGTACLQ